MPTAKQVATHLGCTRGRVIKLVKRGVLNGCLDTDPKAGSFSGNMRYWISDTLHECRLAVDAAEKGGE